MCEKNIGFYHRHRFRILLISNERFILDFVMPIFSRKFKQLLTSKFVYKELILIYNTYIKILILVVTLLLREQIQINERRVVTFREDRPGLSQMRPRSGLSY